MMPTAASVRHPVITSGRGRRGIAQRRGGRVHAGAWLARDCAWRAWSISCPGVGRLLGCSLPVGRSVSAQGHEGAGVLSVGSCSGFNSVPLPGRWCGGRLVGGEDHRVARMGWHGPMALVARWELGLPSAGLGEVTVRWRGVAGWGSLAGLGLGRSRVVVVCVRGVVRWCVGGGRSGRTGRCRRSAGRARRGRGSRSR